MRECIIPIKLETKDDVYFGISCNIKKMVEITIQNLIEHRKVIEESRWYELTSN